MTKPSEMNRPAQPTGMERMHATQGEGPVQLPAFAVHSVPRGMTLALMRPMLADLSGTTMVDPTAGKVRWNNAVPASATAIAISHTDGDTEDLGAAIEDLEAGGVLHIQGAGPDDVGNWQQWTIDEVDSNAGWVALTVTLRASGGAFAEGDELLLSVQQAEATPGLGGEDKTVYAATVDGGTLVLDLQEGARKYFSHALDASLLLEIQNPAVGQASQFELHLLQDGGGFELVIPAAWTRPTSDDDVNPDDGTLTVVRGSTFDSGANYVVEVLSGYQADTTGGGDESTLKPVMANHGEVAYFPLDEASGPTALNESENNPGDDAEYDGAWLFDRAPMYLNAGASIEVSGADAVVRYNPTGDTGEGMSLALVVHPGSNDVCPMVQRDDAAGGVGDRFFNLDIDETSIVFGVFLSGGFENVFADHGLADISAEPLLVGVDYDAVSGQVQIFLNGTLLETDTIGTGYALLAAHATPIRIGNYDSENAALVGTKYADVMIAPYPVGQVSHTQYADIFNAA